MSTELNDKHTEFEVKHRVAPEDMVKFKRLVMGASPINYVHAEGTDYYLVNETGFWRYRTEDWTKDKRKELTKKIKPDGAKNNISRFEYNIRLGPDTAMDTIFESLKHDGYKFNFSVWKTAEIYFTNDATIVFYSAVDTTPGIGPNENSFLEIEVDEELIGTLTPDQAWEIIEKYEKLFSPIGVTPRTRLKKSLFDIYVKK